jgi:hypothetical protein
MMLVILALVSYYVALAILDHEFRLTVSLSVTYAAVCTADKKNKRPFGTPLAPLSNAPGAGEAV